MLRDSVLIEMSIYFHLSVLLYMLLSMFFNYTSEGVVVVVCGVHQALSHD